MAAPVTNALPASLTEPLEIDVPGRRGWQRVRYKNRIIGRVRLEAGRWQWEACGEAATRRAAITHLRAALSDDG